MMVIYCCVPLCKRTSKDTKLYHFPKDELLLLEWIKVIGRDDLLTKNIKSYRICELHFCEDQKFPALPKRSNLKKDSIPWIDVPYPSVKNRDMLEKLKKVYDYIPSKLATPEAVFVSPNLNSPDKTQPYIESYLHAPFSVDPLSQDTINTTCLLQDADIASIRFEPNYFEDLVSEHLSNNRCVKPHALPTINLFDFSEEEKIKVEDKSKEESISDPPTVLQNQDYSLFPKEIADCINAESIHDLFNSVNENVSSNDEKNVLIVPNYDKEISDLKSTIVEIKKENSKMLDEISALKKECSQIKSLLTNIFTPNQLEELLSSKKKIIAVHMKIK